MPNAGILDAYTVKRLHLHSPHPVVDGLQVGDEILYGRTEPKLVRFVSANDPNWPGFTRHILFSWRTATKLEWEFRRRSDLVDEASAIVRRDSALRSSDGERRLQDLIDASADTLHSRSFGKRGYVYFFAGERLCKIGFAVDVDARLRNLQFYCETQLAMLGCFLADRAAETEIHARFAHLRHHGEWFELTAELRSYISEAVG